MKRTINIITLATSGLIALFLLFICFICSATISIKPEVSAQTFFLKEKRIAIPYHYSNQTFNKQLSYKNTLFKNRKRSILQDTVLTIIAVESLKFDAGVELQKSFSDSLYFLSVVYHFSSRGPPSSKS